MPVFTVYNSQGEEVRKIVARDIDLAADKLSGVEDWISDHCVVLQRDDGDLYLVEEGYDIKDYLD